MIRLIERDQEQKRWALVIEGPSPTIDAYKRNPHLFNALPHGLYEGEFKRSDIWAADNGFRARLNGTHTSFKVLVSQPEMLDHFAAQNLWYNEDIVYLRGRFDKRGSEILFILGAE